MSSDMMIVCKEDSSSYNGKHTDKAVFIDECSMGEPWHDFGKWFGYRWCGIPSMGDQILGVHDSEYMEFTSEDYLAVEEAIKNKKCHKDMKKDDVLKYLKSHINKHICTENW